MTLYNIHDCIILYNAAARATIKVVTVDNFIAVKLKFSLDHLS